MKTMDGGLKYEYRLLESEIKNLKELMLQHDKLTELAIAKSEANYDERFQKNNEFREQLKDMIATLARQKETDAAIDAVILRLEAAFKAINEKVDMQGSHLSEILNATKKELGEKRDMAIKTVEDKISSDIKVRDEKFSAVDAQMRTLIDSNAEVSNKGITDLNKAVIEINRIHENSQGRLFVINRMVGYLISIVIAVVIAVVIAFFTKH